MLDHIETGYEGKFDFPSREQPPELSYLLASVPRAGSTHLSHLLWRTGCLGAPLEYLNFEAAGPYGFAAASPDLQVQLWRSVVRRRCSPNGVFGVKAFPPQLAQMQQRNAPLLEEVLALTLPRGARRHVVYVRRRDRLAQTASYARASLSGVWRKEQESEAAARIDYSEQAMEAAERGIAFQEAVWERMFTDLKVDPFIVWHEDAISDSAAVVTAIATHFGVKIDPAAAVNVPEIQKQSPGDSRAWMERYAGPRRPA